jgi:hypothetical protein
MFGWFKDDQHLSLALEARHALRILREPLRQHLDRHVAIQIGVSSAVDCAHAAFAELGGDLVVGDLLRHHRRPTRASQFTITVSSGISLRSENSL